MDIRQTSSRRVYANAWMTVREDRIRRADGSPGIYGVVSKPPFAVVIPIEERQVPGVHLVEQFRYPVSERLWEFPQGSVDAGTEPAETARRELVEETGLRAGTLRHLGRLFQAPGFSDQAFDVWVASDLVHGQPRRSVEEQDMRSDWFPVEHFEDMIRAGVVRDASSVAAWGLARLAAL